MNIQQLAYIVAIDKFKNFSKAAESCFIAQATLSTMVKRLEEELDVILFDRKTSPILTTDVGKPIIEEAKKVLHHTSNLKQISSEIKDKVEGELRIGIIPTVASNLLHRILPLVLGKYPLLKLYIQEITTKNIITQLKTGELDVGIVSTPLSTTELEEEILYYEKLMVYGKIEKRGDTYLRPKDIAKHKIWLLEQGNCLSDQIVNVCSLNPKKINANLTFNPNSFDTLINMVDNFEGLTIIPELYFRDLSAEKRDNVNDFRAPYPVREISMVYHRPYAKCKLISTLSEEIKQIICPLLDTSKLPNRDMVIAKM